MIVVTGGAGFIGSNIVKGLNAQGRNDILVVDDLTNGHKFKNLVGCDVLDYMDKDDFIEKIKTRGDEFVYIETIFHQGACSTTTEWDGRYMMNNNYEYSKTLLKYCLDRQISFIYASSAAVYGAGKTFAEGFEHESPINVYAYSKYLFDQYVRRKLDAAKSQVVGLRYFNVYGSNEEHKGGMASVAYHLNNQIKQTGEIKLFEGCDGYGDGEQRRDFIYIDDIVALNLWFWQNADKSGIFNAGTGRSQPFNDVAKAVLDWHDRGELSYIPFPEHLKGSYQSFTQADTAQLREVGCDQSFDDVATGVKKYLDRLNKDEHE